MEVICLEDMAFYAPLDKVVARVKDMHAIKEEKWISGVEAMGILRISSKTTLQKLRDEGRIRLSQPDKRVILYAVASIYAYLEKNAWETF